MLPEKRILRTTTRDHLDVIDRELGVAQKWLAQIIEDEKLDPDHELVTATQRLASARGHIFTGRGSGVEVGSRDEG